MQHQRLVHRPLASFSTMQFTNYRVLQPPQSTIVSTTLPPVEEVDAAPAPLVPPVVEKQKFTIKKKHTPIAPTPATPVTAPVEKQKLKITIVRRKHSLTETPLTENTLTENPTNRIKIKITIKKQPKQDEKKQQQKCCTNDFAPPVSMIYTPCGDYIAPPPKCCRFFIENRHCFLRSSDNACIDPINKKVFGFWNCEIGKKCELLPPPPTDDDDLDQQHDDVTTSANVVQLDKNDDDDCNKIDAFEMRKKSDANRARITGQPVALLRQKIATKYGMLWCRR